MRFRTQPIKIVQHLSSQKRQPMSTALRSSFVHTVVNKYDPANARSGKRPELRALLLPSSNQCLSIVHVQLLLMSMVASGTTTLRKLHWMRLEEFGPLAHSLASSVSGLVGQRRTRFSSVRLPGQILMFNNPSLRILSHTFRISLYGVGMQQRI